jgi:superfamily II RNA helicase
MGVVSEINPILMAQLCREWNYFETFEPKDLVALLSVFTDVRSNEESRIRSDKVFVKSLEKIVDSLFQLEEKHGIYMKDSGLDGLCYDLVEIMYDWCNCENAEACRILLGNIGISVGDFTKAVLKISTLARELMSVCEHIGKLELMRKLSEVDRLILKYVATNQSLYL